MNLIKLSNPSLLKREIPVVFSMDPPPSRGMTERARGMTFFVGLIFMLLLLAGCAKGNGISMAPYEMKGAWPGDFKLCHGFSCSEPSRIQLTQAQWDKVTAVFKKKAKTPEQEREQISKAIGILETESTKAAGIKPDFGEAETFEGDQAQMDCIDEAINTTHYLEFLDEAGLLKFHSAAPPVHRGFFIDGQWPHNSGAVKEKESGEIYVIDSYYFGSGTPASVVPIDVWLDEWRPKNLPPRRGRS